MTIKRILVPVDFSQSSLVALDYAIDFAKPFDAEVVVLFVVEPVVYATPADLYGASADLGMVLKEQERGGREQLASLQKRLQSRYASLRTLMQTGTPYLVIAETARRQKADLIIMATHGRTGLSHLFLGSVAEKVVRTAACPVLTVPARKTRQRKPTRSRSSGKR